MNRLFGVEAERVLAVLDATTDALTTLSHIPQRVDPTLVRELNERGASRLGEAVRTLWRLEEGQVRHQPMAEPPADSHARFVVLDGRVYVTVWLCVGVAAYLCLAVCVVLVPCGGACWLAGCGLSPGI